MLLRSFLLSVAHSQAQTLSSVPCLCVLPSNHQNLLLVISFCSGLFLCSVESGLVCSEEITHAWFPFFRALGWVQSTAVYEWWQSPAGRCRPKTFVWEWAILNDASRRRISGICFHVDHPFKHTEEWPPLSLAFISPYEAQIFLCSLRAIFFFFWFFHVVWGGWGSGRQLFKGKLFIHSDSHVCFIGNFP